MKKYKDITSYIANLPKEAQKKLKEVRKTIKSAAPSAVESISYGMPAFKLHGKPLAYFAQFKDHVGFFPTVSPIKNFKKELKGFKTSKGTIQIPNEMKTPTALLKKIVKFRASEIKKAVKNR